MVDSARVPLLLRVRVPRARVFAPVPATTPTWELPSKEKFPTVVVMGVAPVALNDKVLLCRVSVPLPKGTPPKDCGAPVRVL